MTEDDVLAILKNRILDCEHAWSKELGSNESGKDHQGRKTLDAVAAVYAERDALLAVLREFQDGRRISNPHTRQVARDIEQQALARSKGGAS
jgi:hypothetical protein